MRVLMTVSNWQGHYCSLVPTAWALQAAGHDVRIGCAPAQAETITRAGLTPAPVLDGLDVMFLARTMLYIEAAQGRRTMPGMPANPLTGEALTRLEDFDLDSVRDEIKDRKLEAIKSSFDGAVAFARSFKPDLILHEPLSPEGALAARVVGVRSALHLWGPAGVMESEPGLFLGPADPTGAFDRYGVGPYNRETEYVVDASPSALEPEIGTATRLPMRYVPYNGAGRIPERIGGGTGRRRIVIIWGSSATGMFGLGASALQRAIDAVAAGGDDIVVTTNETEAGALTSVPDNVRVHTLAPLRHLLDGASLLVHHGSANCLMTAAALGVPQLSLAMSGEQLAISGRFDAAGVCRTLPGQHATPPEIAALSQEILADPAYLASADRMRADIASRPTPARVAAQLEEIAGRAETTSWAAVPVTTGNLAHDGSRA